jgi:hypothetical protein
MELDGRRPAPALQNLNYPLTPIRTEIRCPLYTILALLGPPKGGPFSHQIHGNQCKIAVFSAPHQLSVGGIAGDYDNTWGSGMRISVLFGRAVMYNHCEAKCVPLCGCFIITPCQSPWLLSGYRLYPRL